MQSFMHLYLLQLSKTIAFDTKLTYGTTVAFDILRFFKEIHEVGLPDSEDRECTINSNETEWTKQVGPAKVRLLEFVYA